MNEFLLLISVVFVYGSVIFWGKNFGYSGLLAFIVFATILANIEVLLLVKAFGMEQTLGNVLFASTFLATDIISEFYGKQKAKKAVFIGIISIISFMTLSFMWLHYRTINEDIFTAFNTIFSNTPRIVLASIAVYVIVQYIDVNIYHYIWEKTTKNSARERLLWLRNNASTLISQLINSVLFTIFAFYGVYDVSTLLDIMLTTYVIFVAAALLDTPFIYLYRHLFYSKNSQLNT